MIRSRTLHLWAIMRIFISREFFRRFNKSEITIPIFPPSHLHPRAESAGVFAWLTPAVWSAQTYPIHPNTEPRNRCLELQNKRSTFFHDSVPLPQLGRWHGVSERRYITHIGLSNSWSLSASILPLSDWLQRPQNRWIRGNHSSLTPSESIHHNHWK